MILEIFEDITTQEVLAISLYEHVGKFTECAVKRHIKNPCRAKLRRITNISPKEQRKMYEGYRSRADFEPSPFVPEIKEL